MRYSFFIVLLVAILIVAGCVSQNTNVVVIAPQTTMVPTVMATTTVPSNVTSKIQTPITGPVAGKVTVYFFYGEECPHCHNVIPFIQNLSKKYPYVDFQILEIWHNETNNAFSKLVNQQLAIQNPGVPEVIVVGNNTPLIGERNIPEYLEGIILEQLKNKQ